VSQDDDERTPRAPNNTFSRFDQFAANALSLMFRKNSHRAERYACDCANSRRAEQDVADHSTIQRCDQREGDASMRPQGVNEVTFPFLTEGAVV